MGTYPSSPLLFITFHHCLDVSSTCGHTGHWSAGVTEVQDPLPPPPTPTFPPHLNYFSFCDGQFSVVSGSEIVKHSNVAFTFGIFRRPVETHDTSTVRVSEFHTTPADTHTHTHVVVLTVVVVVVAVVDTQETSWSRSTQEEIRSHD